MATRKKQPDSEINSKLFFEAIDEMTKTYANIDEDFFQRRLPSVIERAAKRHDNEKRQRAGLKKNRERKERLNREKFRRLFNYIRRETLPSIASNLALKRSDERFDKLDSGVLDDDTEIALSIIDETAVEIILEAYEAINAKRAANYIEFVNSLRYRNAIKKSEEAEEKYNAAKAELMKLRKECDALKIAAELPNATEEDKKAFEEKKKETGLQKSKTEGRNVDRKLSKFAPEKSFLEIKEEARKNEKEIKSGFAELNFSLESEISALSFVEDLISDEALKAALQKKIDEDGDEDAKNALELFKVRLATDGQTGGVSFVDELKFVVAPEEEYTYDAIDSLFKAKKKAVYKKSVSGSESENDVYIAEMRIMVDDYILEKENDRVKQILTAEKENNISRERSIRCAIDWEKKTAKLLRKYLIIDNDAEKTDIYQFTLDEAYIAKPLKRGESYDVGDVIEIEIKNPGEELGRGFALNVKNMLRREIKDEEKNAKNRKLKEKKERIVSAKVVSIEENGDFRITIGEDMFILEKENMLEKDKSGSRAIKVGDFVTVYIFVRKKGDVESIEISRTHPDMIKKVLEKHIPELEDGTIKIIGKVAREAGSRTKIAVKSTREDVDAVGTCIGNNGSRIKSVSSELAGESVDVIPYSEDAEKFVAAALSPAKILSIKIVSGTDEDSGDTKNLCEVVVPNERYSLAIGNRGQNVRLAANLTGYKIDIKPEIDNLGLFEDSRSKRL